MYHWREATISRGLSPFLIETLTGWVIGLPSIFASLNQHFHDGLCAVKTVVPAMRS